jgi:hypothetical protein
MRCSGVITFTSAGYSPGAGRMRKISAVRVPGAGAVKLKSISRCFLDSSDLSLSFLEHAEICNVAFNT